MSKESRQRLRDQAKEQDKSLSRRKMLRWVLPLVAVIVLAAGFAAWKVSDLGSQKTKAMRTACAAGMHAVGVLWGFRDRHELVESGAEHIVAKPEDVLALL